MKNTQTSKSDVSSVREDLSCEILEKDRVNSSNDSKVITAFALPDLQPKVLLCNLNSSSYLSLSSIEIEIGMDETIKPETYDKYLKGNISQLSQTQAGSLFLQKHMDKLSNLMAESLYIEVRPIVTNNRLSQKFWTY